MIIAHLGGDTRPVGRTQPPDDLAQPFLFLHSVGDLSGEQRAAERGCEAAGRTAKASAARSMTFHLAAAAAAREPAGAAAALSSNGGGDSGG